VSARDLTGGLRPQTRYAGAGDAHIAYQAFGSGPVDIVLVPGFVSHVEIAWEEPSLARFLSRLSGFARVIFYDKRGTGLSDRVPLPSFLDLEKRSEDVAAVMDAAGSRQAVLYAWSEGGPLCLLVAARQPQRVQGLVLAGTTAKFAAEPGYPGLDPWLIEQFILACEEDWGNGTAFEFFAPSLAGDERSRRWWARYQRFCSSPGMVASSLRMHLEFDGRPLLPLIQAPALVLHHRDDLIVPFESGRYLAEHIPHAQLHELDGMDHLYWLGDQDAILGRVRAFVEELGGGSETSPRTRRSRRGRPGFGWAAVTESERDVVDLVTRGLTNREIATRLHRSTKTIETHLAHVYDKLDLRSRAELVAAARNQGYADGFRDQAGRP
jgi:pimeloyl-ACP methyl ester carboxylesterase/DNA-binding CsgD family transcriptional regulator